MACLWHLREGHDIWASNQISLVDSQKVTRKRRCYYIARNLHTRREIWSVVTEFRNPRASSVFGPRHSGLYVHMDESYGTHNA